jgi:crotonobetainyl-CoA:carnitine CoA-transferase CaiB-like acyl-CoA transferase
MGRPTWTDDPTLDTAAGRRERAAALDIALADWTRGQDAEALASRLQESGVEAAPVAAARELLADPQLRARGHWVAVQHPKLGRLLLERSGFRLSASAGGFQRAGPNLGEHSEAILRELLGLDDAEIARLGAQGVLT